MLCLKVATDARWAAWAVSRLDDLLIDHAHCEMKAASNALSLAMRHCEDATLAQALTDLAREEIDHYQRVLALLVSRGTSLRPPSVDTYAAELRDAAHALPRDDVASPLVDRLLVGALIEARSCERFKLLAEASRDADALDDDRGDADALDAPALWSELFAAEAGHYRTFVDLAVRAAGGDRTAVTARLERLAEAEGALVHARNLLGETADRATIHG